MTKFRPLTVGSQVVSLVNQAPGIIRQMYENLGQADVEFKDGSVRRVSLSLIQRRRRNYPSRAKTQPKSPAPVQVERQLADVVKERMRVMDLTHDELARRSGLSRSSLWRMLHRADADPLLSSVERLAGALGLSPGAFWREETSLNHTDGG